MSDVFSPEKRSSIMRAVKGEGTRPEMFIRRLAFSLGYRYRLHSAKLPGKPDLVFPARRKVIFVHGCFWHRHRCGEGRSTPASRQEYWLKKLAHNVARDARTRRQLRRLGWRSLVIWECQAKPKQATQLAQKIRAFLDSSVAP